MYITNDKWLIIKEIIYIYAETVLAIWERKHIESIEKAKQLNANEKKKRMRVINVLNSTWNSR